MRVKTFSAGVCPVTWCPQHPQFDPILLPQPSALLSYSLTSPSQTIIPLRGALALPPPRFVASFPVYCGLFFLQQAYLLIFHTGRSNTFCTCGDLHLQDPRGSLPSLMKQEGGLGDRKMHDSFKLLLLSPSRTWVHASTQKAFLLFVSHWKKKICLGFFLTNVVFLCKILPDSLLTRKITANHPGMLRWVCSGPDALTPPPTKTHSSHWVDIFPLLLCLKCSIPTTAKQMHLLSHHPSSRPLLLPSIPCTNPWPLLHFLP